MMYVLIKLNANRFMFLFLCEPLRNSCYAEVHRGAQSYAKLIDQSDYNYPIKF